MRGLLNAVLVLGLSGCVVLAPPTDPRPTTVSGGNGTANFAAVVAQVEPVAERICRRRAPGSNCDFLIAVDTRPGQPANAYQSLDDQGRPVLTFTNALIGQAQNDDELAFVMGHEAAHHISGHLVRKRDSALAGALLGGLLATLAGGGAQAIDTAQNLGGTVGARVYSKDFELEADRLGTEIAFRAGFDPIVGARFFTRIPDPGDRFLGSHPPNADRIRTVRTAMAGLNP